MKFKSSYGFSVIRRLVFRIELAPPGADAHLSEKEIARSLSENYPFYKMKVKGDIATFSGLDGDGNLASFDCSGARAYRHSFGGFVDEGGPVMVQLGFRNSGSADPAHLRVVIDGYTRNSRPQLMCLMADLAAFCDEPDPFNESRITLEEIEASFILAEQSIEDVVLAHQSRSAGALETMVDAKGRVCGYQIGRHLDSSRQSEIPRAEATKQVEGIGFWTQTREFALHSLDCFRDGHSGVSLQVQLGGEMALKTLGQKNRLAGLEFEFPGNSGAKKGARVAACDWNPEEAWARIVLEASAVGARD